MFLQPYGSHVAAAVLPFPGGLPEDKLFQRVYRAYECPGLLEPPENLQSLLLRQAFSFSCLPGLPLRVRRRRWQGEPVPTSLKGFPATFVKDATRLALRSPSQDEEGRSGFEQLKP